MLAGSSRIRWRKTKIGCLRGLNSKPEMWRVSVPRNYTSSSEDCVEARMHQGCGHEIGGSRALATQPTSVRLDWHVAHLHPLRRLLLQTPK